MYCTNPKTHKKVHNPKETLHNSKSCRGKCCVPKQRDCHRRWYNLQCKESDFVSQTLDAIFPFNPNCGRNSQVDIEAVRMASDLEELRRAIIAGEKISTDSVSIIIGDRARLHRIAPTVFHSMRGRGDAYIVESIYFQFKFKDLHYNDYIQACRREGVAHVTALDKKDLLAYLTGEIDTCASIVSKPPEPSTSRTRPTNASVTTHPTVEEPSKSHIEKDAKRDAATTGTDTSSFSAYRMRDRDQRSLDSVLMVPEWDFSALREKLAQHIASAKVGKNTAAENGPNGTAPAYDPRGDRYTSNEDRFWRENLGSEFHELGIDMSGSFKAKPTAANGQPAEKRRDRPEGRRATVKETPTKRKRIDPKELVPIIIVPQGSSLIFSGNAVEFFQNGRFISREELQKSNVATTLGASRSTAMRTPGGNCSRAEYLIISNPNRLTSSEWERVVAVVCSGQEWQFKNWPINEQGVQDLFRNIQGFYFHYEDSNPSGDVNSWAIKKLALSRNRRHTDGQVQVQFWNALDAFLRRKGKQLRY